jgi:LuxR family transcriptional regulator, maltose regulon positive regulatory protein
MTAGVARASQASIRGNPAWLHDPARRPVSTQPSASRYPPTTVTTKLLVPPVPHDLIQRTRLFDALDHGIARTLVLLAAPAGAGKTMLLASWARKRKLPGPVCWLTLDSDDTDSAQLSGDLLSALRSCGMASPGSALDRLTPPRSAHDERFLPLLVNALAELSTPVVIVLDEIPELARHPASAALAYLVRHAPEQCRLVLCGRCDPPLPLERLRLCDELTELRASDLAFDREETAELCRRLGLEISETAMSALWTRTEGWAAAVRLAALTLKDHPEPDRFLTEFAGTDRAIADYLVAEVLANLPEQKLEFMLRTSLVLTIDPELADALTESQGAALKLSELEHAGVPVQQVSEHQAGDVAYQYHPLFRELLQAQLRATHPRTVTKLHRLAAGWYAEHDRTSPAIHHALAGEDWRRASGLIAEHWLDLFLRGEATSMSGPMSRLPAEVVASDPRLGAALAASRLQDGDIAAGESHLEYVRHLHASDRRQDHGSGAFKQVAGQDVGKDAGADQAGRPSRGDTLEKALIAVCLHLERLRGHASEAETFAATLHRLEGRIRHEDWSALRSFTLSNLGATHLWCAEPTKAGPELLEALAIATEYELEHIVLDCQAQLALLDLLNGSLRSAHERARRALESIERGGLEQGLTPAYAYLAGAAVAFRRGEFERAEELASRLVHSSGKAHTGLRAVAGMLQAVILSTAGPESAERGALKLSVVRTLIADESPKETFHDHLLVALADAQARVLSATGEHDAALEGLRRARIEHPQSLALLIREASIELRRGAHADATRTLAPVIPEDPCAEDPREPLGESLPGAAIPMLIEGWLLRALLAYADGERRVSSQALERALALTEHEPYHEAFLLNGPPVGELLEHQAESGTAHPAVLETLLQAGSQCQCTATPPAEALTEREQAILRFLPTLLSNAEIGAEMYVSLNTVKTHLRSIYRKLDAGSRADAVERARQNGLLPPGIKRPHVRRI